MIDSTRRIPFLQEACRSDGPAGSRRFERPCWWRWLRHRHGGRSGLLGTGGAGQAEAERSWVVARLWSGRKRTGHGARRGLRGNGWFLHRLGFNPGTQDQHQLDQPFALFRCQLGRIHTLTIQFELGLIFFIEADGEQAVFNRHDGRAGRRQG